jgi:hypothetical protein
MLVFGWRDKSNMQLLSTGVEHAIGDKMAITR